MNIDFKHKQVSLRHHFIWAIAIVVLYIGSTTKLIKKFLF